jgi:hypothetical protein
VACNDDEDFDNQVYNSYLEVTTEPGVNYLLIVDGYVFPTDYEAIGSFCLEITKLETVDVVDLQSTEYSLYPNPTNGRVQLDGFTADRIEVYDPFGRLVGQRLTPANGYDLESLPAGVYTLKLTVGEEVFSARVIKQ